MKTVNTKKAPDAIGPYSQAVIHNGLVYTSGQIPIDPQTGNLHGTDIETQTEQVMNNLSHVLKACGSDLSQVIKTTCFIRDMNDFAKFNEVYSRYITQKPARSCVAVKELPKQALVEVEVVAKKTE